MTTRLEHANLTVRDVDETIRFLQTAFPEFRLRAEGKTWAGSRWVHVGTDDVYLALTQAREGGELRGRYSGKPGTNHLGFEVEDAEKLRERMRAAGYEDSTVPNNHPYRRRVYFYDKDGNDWEFVQYLTDDPEKRHDYSLSD